MFLTKQRKQENLIYLAVWAVLFAAPLLSIYARSLSDSVVVFRWIEVFQVWRLFVSFLLAFLIHNFFLAPQLVYKGKRIFYFTSVLVILVAFQLFQCTHRPEHFDPELHEQEIRMNRQTPSNTMYKMGEHRQKGFMPPQKNMDSQQPPFDFDKQMGERHGPPVFFGGNDIVAFIVVLLMLGLNLLVKYYFKFDGERKKMKELERKNLEQQLEYLKYQINPHFFMNTLNNIHALVDIEPEKAKSTIEELSKMMRYVLYEGNKKLIPLNKEVTFLSGYVRLMSIRYTDKVSITTDFNIPPTDKCIPPLLLVTFVENAFKHGISYEKDSFIHVKMEISDKDLVFLCENSKVASASDTHGGVGLENTHKRLDLIFGQKYSLETHDDDTTYQVRLSIPLLLPDNV